MRERLLYARRVHTLVVNLFAHTLTTRSHANTNQPAQVNFTLLAVPNECPEEATGVNVSLDSVVLSGMSGQVNAPPPPHTHTYLCRTLSLEMRT
jgi:hypothetical protein